MKIPKSLYPYVGGFVLFAIIVSPFTGSGDSNSSPTPTNRPTRSQTPLASPTQSAEPTETTIADEQPAPEESVWVDLLSQLSLASEMGAGYDRDLFRHWIDSDGDGCNTRREVLIEEAIEKPTISGDCDLFGGTWYSVFDGVATEDPGNFDIDHFIPLKEAWDSGAHAWSASQRRAFANDLGNPESLIAVTATSNRSKSDRDPADWLPPNQAYHCQYIATWVKIKIFWGLSVDEREFLAIRRIAASC